MERKILKIGDVGDIGERKRKCGEGDEGKDE